jgi:hypothetical protein
MVTIYKDKRTDKLYALNEMITMGAKVNLVQMGGKEDKFVSPSALKRWFTKWDEAQQVVEVKAFTGMVIGWFKVLTESKETITVLTKQDKFLDFDKNTDAQVNAKNPKFANHIGMTLGYPTVF